MVRLTPSLKLTISAFLVVFVAISYNSFVKAVPFSGVTPNLSTGWFHKPGPAESIFFGLIVLKVLALRMAGVFPYNLNELMAEGGYLEKNGLSSWSRKKRTERDLFSKPNKMNKFSKAPLLQEIEAVERILLGLRRIDSHDCFIRHVCHVNQKSLAGKSTAYDEAILKIFSMKPKKATIVGEKSIWDIYGDALHPVETDCRQKYKNCPLTKKDMKLTSLLTGFF